MQADAGFDIATVVGKKLLDIGCPFDAIIHMDAENVMLVLFHDLLLSQRWTLELPSRLSSSGPL
jgi:hypothetical protein